MVVNELTFKTKVMLNLVQKNGGEKLNNFVD